MPYDAFSRLAKTLQQPGIWGERVIGVIPLPNAPKNAGSQVVYGFLSPHPLGGPKPLAMIGLFADKITIDLFSLHIDLTGGLARRIAKPNNDHENQTSSLRHLYPRHGAPCGRQGEHHSN
jgi:hypothetical protein